MKKCKICLQEKDMTNYSPCNTYKGKTYYRLECKECIKDINKTPKAKLSQLKCRLKKGQVKNICWQKLKRDENIEKDKKAGMPFNLKASDFILNSEKLTQEHKDFILKYEWLGTTGFGTRWVFTARYNGMLAGVVFMAEPYQYKFDKSIEVLIQRGASSSWAPTNLNSKLIMFSCNWMVKNTTKRVFVAYSDFDAGEIGTIYQACNFDYLGDTFGTKIFYKINTNRFVNSRYFTRTSSMKKWAKELNIVWLKEWDKVNGFQDISKIPKDIYSMLKERARFHLKQCEKKKGNKKGKYILLLNYGHDKIKKTWKSLPYPKRELHAPK